MSLSIARRVDAIEKLLDARNPKQKRPYLIMFERDIDGITTYYVNDKEFTSEVELNKYLDQFGPSEAMTIFLVRRHN